MFEPSEKDVMALVDWRHIKPLDQMDLTREDDAESWLVRQIWELRYSLPGDISPELKDKMLSIGERLPEVWKSVFNPVTEHWVPGCVLLTKYEWLNYLDYSDYVKLLKLYNVSLDWVNQIMGLISLLKEIDLALGVRGLSDRLVYAEVSINSINRLIAKGELVNVEGDVIKPVTVPDALYERLKGIFPLATDKTIYSQYLEKLGYLQRKVTSAHTVYKVFDFYLLK